MLLGHAINIMVHKICEDLRRSQCYDELRSASLASSSCSLLYITFHRYVLMYQCWADKPEDRSTFSEIVVQLSKLLESMNGYLELKA